MKYGRLLFLTLTFFSLWAHQSLAQFTPTLESAALRYADSVVAFSTQWSPTSWSAQQALGSPNTYPNYGDIATAWASLTQDDQREFLELWYSNPARISHVAIYETYNPGAVDTIYVKNPNTSLWEVAWSGTALSAGTTSRIFQVSFPLTSFNVSEIRIAINSPIVPSWNEIDAVGISDSPIMTAGHEEEIPIRSFELRQNYPNPFNPSTTIEYQLPHSGLVSLKVFNSLGQVIATLVNEHQGAGIHKINWKADGQPSGVYYCRIETDRFRETKKIILLR